MIIHKDVSKGYEIYPIRVVNDIDGETKLPRRFTYIVEPFVTRLHEHPEAESCNCFGGCSDSRPCTCVMKNEGEKIQYKKDGTITRTTGEWIIYECGRDCKCPPTCQNRVSQRGLLIQLEVFKTETRGWGVRSPQLIRKNSFICEYLAEIVDDEEAEHRSNDEYMFDLAADGGLALDGILYGNVGRFFNHSHSPNMFSQKVLYDHTDENACRIAFFALDEDIQPMTELTHNYGYKIDSVRGADGKIKKKDCYCGSNNCTGRLY